MPNRSSRLKKAVCNHIMKRMNEKCFPNEERKRGGRRVGAGRPSKASRRIELKIDKAVFFMLERLKKGFSGNRTAAMEAAVRNLYAENIHDLHEVPSQTTAAPVTSEHELKIWSEPFDAVSCGRKNFEIRRNDRAFKVGDTLRLREFNPEDHTYSGREVKRVITYMIVGGEWGLPKELCVLGWSLADNDK